MMHRLLILCLQLAAAVALLNWPDLSQEVDTGTQSERDISYPVPLDQTSGIGISLSTSIFKNGYTDDSLDDLLTLLNVGFRIIHIDLYWNSFLSVWQLCPAPYPTNITADASIPVRLTWNNRQYYCQPEVTTDSIMELIYIYMTSTNTNMDVSFLQVLYSLHEITAPTHANSTVTSQYSPAMFDDQGNSTLSATVSWLGSLLFTPVDQATFVAQRSLSSSDSYTFYNSSVDGFPSLEYFLLTDVKRIQATVINNQVSSSLYDMSAADEETIFFLDDTLNATIASTESEALDSCEALLQSGNLLQFLDLALDSTYRYAFDNNDTSFTIDSLTEFLRCGFSPVLNATSYAVNETVTSDLGTIVDYFLPLSFWSWDRGQPKSEDTLSNSLRYSEDEEVDQVAYRCVALDDGAFQVKNCYQSYDYACKNDSNPLDWFINGDKKTYFDAYTDSQCPDGFLFGVPRLSVEMMSLTSKLESRESTSPVWLDFNDITVENCFVSGGPYAECPYQRVISTTRLAQLLAPACVVTIVVLILLFLQQVVRTNPIQTNRKRYWKKALNDYYEKNDSEGVPS